jgi:hypothetical protein
LHAITRRPLALLGFALAIVAAGAFGLGHALSDSTTVYQACYKASGASAGAVRLIGQPGAPNACPAGFSPFSFNQQGVQGPQGPQGPSGAPLPQALYAKWWNVGLDSTHNPGECNPFITAPSDRGLVIRQLTNIQAGGNISRNLYMDSSCSEPVIVAPANGGWSNDLGVAIAPGASLYWTVQKSGGDGITAFVYGYTYAP